MLEEVELEGFRFKKDTRVLVVFGAANRDASRFPNPHSFDIERKTAGHVGFGHGVHACLGMNLARLEMSCLFNALADRVKRFELCGLPVIPLRVFRLSVCLTSSIFLRVSLVSKLMEKDSTRVFLSINLERRICAGPI